MRVPISWLKQYVDVEISAKELADKLTFSGTEIEGIEQIGSTYENFVVGEVREVAKHPNADKLTVCKVFDGIGEVQVVCGAPNVQACGKYPFAKIGATIPNGGFAIKKAKLRGVESNGMLCAADELGQPGGHDGLFVLDSKWAAGTPLSQVFGPPETVLELEITPNRPDCLSMIGIAREVAAVTGKKLAWPAIANCKSQIANVLNPRRPRCSVRRTDSFRRTCCSDRSSTCRRRPGDSDIDPAPTGASSSICPRLP